MARFFNFCCVDCTDDCGIYIRIAIQKRQIFFLDLYLSIWSQSSWFRTYHEEKGGGRTNAYQEFPAWGRKSKCAISVYYISWI